MLVPLDERECHCLLCEPRIPVDDLSPREYDKAKVVAEYGWAVTGVFGMVRGWAYTMGLWHTFGSPEICIIGMHHERAAQYVNIVAEQIRDGRPLKPREIRTGVLGGWDDTLAPAPVHDSWYPRLFGAAIDFFQDPPFPVVQLVWPDGYGRFLWDPEVHPGTREVQPALYLPLEDAHPAWRACERREPSLKLAA